MTRRQQRSFAKKKYHRMRRYRDQRAGERQFANALVLSIVSDMRMYCIGYQNEEFYHEYVLKYGRRLS